MNDAHTQAMDDSVRSGQPDRHVPVDSTARGLAALLEVSRSLVVSLDLAFVLQAMVDGVERLSGLDTAAVYLLQGDQLRLWATTPPLPPDFPEELRVAPLADHPHVSRALSSHLPILVPDQETAALSLAEAEVMRRRNLRTVLYLPLIAGRKTVGTLIVGSVGMPRAVSTADVDLCRTLANLAALAVENARLFESTQRQAEQLRQTLADRHRAEEAREKLRLQLLQAQKMESIGRLAGGVAHDFNNMLQVILGCTEALLDGPTDGVAWTENLQEIRQAAQRSANLTRQLLAFARRQSAEPRVLDVNSTVEGMLRMLRRLIGEDLDLVWRPGGSMGSVRMDPSQVEQVLANLCVNARDAIEDTGSVTVETRGVTFDEAHCAEHVGFRPGDFVMIAVSDTGCGMSREILEHIFEPFFTTKAVGQGTGLGLATVYGIVQQNQGFIHVESEPGRGTTFRIYLPRYAAVGPAEGAECPARPVATPGEGTILVVEDEPAILRIIADMLRRCRYEVLTAGGPVQALQRAREHGGRIDLLLTDVVMPEMNGLELARQLAAIQPGVRCLFMSGYTSDAIARHGLIPHDKPLLIKPFAVDQLTQKVREVLAETPVDPVPPPCAQPP